MSKATLSQGQQILNLISQSGIERDELQTLIRSGRLTALLREFMGDNQLGYPAPTITPIKFARNYGQTLVQARDGMRLGGYVEQDVNDQSFPPEGRDGDREFVLVCFHREIDDHEEPEKSELLRELDKLGLQPEGPMELCFVGTDEKTRDLQLKFPIVARRQGWRNPAGGLHCPFLYAFGHEGDLDLNEVQAGWFAGFHFLASRK